MKRTLNFAKRNFLEIIRDPLSLIFAVILPLFLLFIFQQFDIPAEVYKIENFTAGILVFGFAFISMFTATLVAKDRATSLLIRLGVSPMKSLEYVVGYALSVIPLILIQNILFFTLAAILGLSLTVGVLWAILVSLPVSVLFICMGILIGSIATEKSSVGVSSVVVQLVAFTSGMYFSGDMVGKGFNAVCKALPFEPSVNIIRTLLNGLNNDLTFSVITLAGYTVAVSIVTAIVFNKNMLSGKK